MTVHIGKIIEQKFQESGMKLPAFAEKIDTGERNVYSIFKREDINASMLKKISTVLEFNFFELYEDGMVFREPVVDYRIKDKPFVQKVEFTLPFKSIDELPRFLRDLNETAEKYGFRIG